MNYDALKDYLEAPPVTVVPTDPFWSDPLLPEDAEWPAPFAYFDRDDNEEQGDLDYDDWDRLMKLLVMWQICMRIDNDVDPEQVRYDRVYIRRWWSKCRSVLAFHDATTAEIEWMTESVSLAPAE